MPEASGPTFREGPQGRYARPSMLHAKITLSLGDKLSSTSSLNATVAARVREPSAGPPVIESAGGVVSGAITRLP